jgi:hypothetical protein
MILLIMKDLIIWISFKYKLIIFVIILTFIWYGGTSVINNLGSLYLYMWLNLFIIILLLPLKFIP